MFWKFLARQALRSLALERSPASGVFAWLGNSLIILEFTTADILTIYWLIILIS